MTLKTQKQTRSIHKYFRVMHNKKVVAFFKERKSDTQVSLKNSLLIYKDDSLVQINLKLTFFKLYLDSEMGIVSLPYEWDIKAETDRPQLAIIYREKGKTQTGNHTSYIPHYNGTRNPNFSAYVQGNYWARIRLKDNSYILAYGSSEAVAKKIVNERLRYVKSAYIDTRDVALGKLGSNRIKRVRVEPIRADFYPHGRKKIGTQRGLVDWRVYF